MTADPTLDVRLLGGFEVRFAGRPVPSAVWRQRRPAAIVKLLALQPDIRLHREQLLDALWPDLDPDSAANNLRVALHVARRGLAAAGAPPDQFLTRDGDRVLLGPPDRVVVDTLEFATAASRAWQSDDPSIAEHALSLYRGDLLPEDPYEDWAAARREGVRASYLTLLDRLAGLHEARGQFAAAVAARERALVAEPLDEAVHVALMRLHAAMGHPASALAQFARLQAVLDRELGAEPDRQTRELAAAIREGRFTPAIAPAPPAISQAAPTRIAVAAPARLPIAVDALVGRERELAEIARLFSSARMLTLTGPGGTGKTRLAMEVARSAAGRFPDGVAFVDLAPVRDPSQVTPAIARALAVEESGIKPTGDLVAEAIGDARVLLVLDNLEHLTDAGSDIAALPAACPALTILATSRARLRLRGEQEYPVSPLGLPEHAQHGRAPSVADVAEAPAMKLFAIRAAEARPDFALTADNVHAALAVCRRLDGLPLAIELAAARIRLLTPAQLQQRLAHSLDVLGAAAQDVPARQRTLRDTVAWSHDLLAPTERRVFRRLSAFAGGWTLDAAAAVAAAEDDGSTIDIVAALGALVDQSLVVAQPAGEGDETRYTMLETIREFAAERLDASPEADRIANRHGEVFLTLAEEAEPHLEGPDQGGWLERLDREYANLAVALRRLSNADADKALRLGGALWRFWWLRGRIAEGRRQLGDLLALPMDADPVARAKIVDGAGVLAENQGDYEAAVDLYREAVSLWERAGDQRRVARSLLNLGNAAAFQGDGDRAAAFYDDGLARLRDLGDRRGVAVALTGLGLTASLEGACELAAARDEEALPLWRGRGDQQGLALTLDNLGEAELHRGRLTQAERRHDEALTILEGLGARRGVASATINLGLVARAAGDRDRATDLLVSGLDIAREVADHDAAARCLEGLAGLAADEASFERAAQVFAAAAELRSVFRMPLPPVYHAVFDADLARVRAALGDDRFAAEQDRARASGWEHVADEVAAAPASGHETVATIP
jgi:predicted ATPase/DNA-binding SARP family transcriptional activator